MFLLSPNLSDSGRHFVSVYLVNSSHPIGSRSVSIVFLSQSEPICNLHRCYTILNPCFVLCTRVTEKLYSFLANQNQVIFVCILLKCLLSILSIRISMASFKPDEPALNGQPVLSGQLAIPQG